MPSLLHRLPQEIRDLIYREVLAPTGFAITHPIDPANKDSSFHVWAIHNPRWRCEGGGEVRAISFSILKTSKDIYKESKDVFFRHNALLVGSNLLSVETSSYLPTHYNRFPHQPVRHIYHSIDFCDCSQNGLGQLLDTLSYADALSVLSGSLESITLNPTMLFRQQTVSPNSTTINDRQHTFAYPAINLLNAAKHLYRSFVLEGNSLCFNGRKTIFLDFDLAIFANIDPGDAAPYPDIEKELQGLSQALDASLFANGTLCYEKGTLVENVVQVEELQELRKVQAEKFRSLGIALALESDDSSSSQGEEGSGDEATYNSNGSPAEEASGEEATYNSNGSPSEETSGEQAIENSNGSPTG